MHESKSRIHDSTRRSADIRIGIYAHIHTLTHLSVYISKHRKLHIQLAKTIMQRHHRYLVIYVYLIIYVPYYATRQNMCSLPETQRTPRPQCMILLQGPKNKPRFEVRQGWVRAFAAPLSRSKGRTKPLPMVTSSLRPDLGRAR